MLVAIVDDDLNILTETESLVAAYGQKHGLDITCTGFQQVEDYIETIGKKRFAVVFMDVNFIEQEKNGVDAAVALRRVDPECILIFLTDSEGYMQDAFSVHAFSYILKDNLKDSLDSIMDDVIRIMPESKILSFVSGRQNYQLMYNDILYACTEGHYIILTDVRGKEWRTRMTFAELTEKLNLADGFLAINKGIVVNMNHIETIKKRDCVMSDGQNFPVRVRDSAEIAQTWHNYMFDTIRRQQRATQKGGTL